MTRYDEILVLLERTPFVDTHEHLLEEKTRLIGPSDSKWPAQSLKDFSVLMSHCSDGDYFRPACLRLIGRVSHPLETTRLFTAHLECVPSFHERAIRKQITALAN